VTRWDALLAICGYLRAGLLGGVHQSPDDVRWESMIEVASVHLVTPALAWCLRDDAMPADVRDYFASVLALNGQRNERMLAGLARMAQALNAIGIEPLLLKGCALIVEELYADPALRLQGDADVLIPKERAADALAALTRAGFATKDSDVVLPDEHHHLPMLHDSRSGLGVELHTDVISSAPDAAIATAWFGERARLVIFRDQRVRLPEPTRNIGHVIFHSHLYHALGVRNQIHLRHLLDVAMIRARYESDIDWAELDRRFVAAHYGEALATYLDFAHMLLGQPAPKLINAPRPDAFDELRRAETRNTSRP
jgi:hypothetical protein